MSRSGLAPYAGTLSAAQLAAAAPAPPREGGFSYVVAPDGVLSFAALHRTMWDLSETKADQGIGTPAGITDPRHEFATEMRLAPISDESE